MFPLILGVDCLIVADVEETIVVEAPLLVV
jgi:hypothetical protein